MQLANDIHVMAPASSANLGPLFDVGAIALDSPCNRVTVTAGTGRVLVRGEGEGALATDHSNLVAACFQQVAGELVQQVDIICDNEVPLARGLGSSTAAAASGLLAGRHAIGAPTDSKWLVEQLTRLDGHADNAAACVHGGMVLAQARGDGSVAVTRMQLPPAISLIAIIPERELETSASRAVLPTTLPLTDAAAQVAAAASLVELLGHDEPDPDALRAALHGDLLHEPARSVLVPELGQARAALATMPANIAFGATLSGAGSTVLAWHRAGHSPAVIACLQDAVRGCNVRAVSAASMGARVADAPSP